MLWNIWTTTFKGYFCVYLEGGKKMEATARGVMNFCDCCDSRSSKIQLVSCSFSSFPRTVQFTPLCSDRICECTKVLGFAATKTNTNKKRTGVRHWSNNPLFMALLVLENLGSGRWGPILLSSVHLEGCTQQVECWQFEMLRHGGENLLNGRIHAVLQREFKQQQYVNLSSTLFFFLFSKAAL